MTLSSLAWSSASQTSRVANQSGLQERMSTIDDGFGGDVYPEDIHDETAHQVNICFSLYVYLRLMTGNRVATSTYLGRQTKGANAHQRDGRLRI